MRFPLLLAVLFLSVECVSAQVVRQRVIVDQRSEGVALTMDFFVPEEPNGTGIIKIVSGGWKSNHAKVKEGQHSSWIYRGMKGTIWKGGHRVPFVERVPKKNSAGHRLR